jgi:pyrimidine-specific ribonucleoside hydrolase
VTNTRGGATAAPMPVVVDCDPGIDDAVALAMALASPELDVLAVTTVRGNAPLEVTTRNALALLHAFGRPDIPVAPGAVRALVRPAGVHPKLHGGNGLGGVEIAESPAAAAEHAIEVLAGVLGPAAPASVTIAALGPLTNIALLLNRHPELADRIDRVVAMGGTVGSGNISAVAEFNVWADPEGAHRVLTEPAFDVVLVGLDVTYSATVDEPLLDVMRAGSPRGALLAAMIAGYGDHGPDGWRMHDALIIGALADPSMIATRRATIDVETGTGLSRGQTVCTFDEHFYDTDGAPAPRGVVRSQVAVSMDPDGFRSMLLSRTAGDVAAVSDRSPRS